jgi:hypothetical protein
MAKNDKTLSVTTTDADERIRETLAEMNDLLARMMTLIEQHTARIERLEFHVLQIQPLPAMRTARKDH